MKFAVFVVLSCLCICLANSLTVTSWGNINARTLGTKNVVVKSSMMQVKTFKFTYPEVDKKIIRIHINYFSTIFWGFKWNKEKDLLKCLMLFLFYSNRHRSLSKASNIWTTNRTQFQCNSWTEVSVSVMSLFNSHHNVDTELIRLSFFSLTK